MQGLIVLALLQQGDRQAAESVHVVGLAAQNGAEGFHGLGVLAGYQRPLATGPVGTDTLETGSGADHGTDAHFALADGAGFHLSGGAGLHFGADRGQTISGQGNGLLNSVGHRGG